MGLVTDAIQTIFRVSGVQQVVSATNSVASAQARVATATVGLNNALQNNNVAQAAKQQIALQNALSAQGKASIVAASANVAGFIAISSAADDAIKSLLEYGNTVMNIRDLTGATAGQSVRAADLFKVAGVSDSQGIRDILRLGKDAFSSQGQGALAQLGITASGNQNGLQLFDQIADKLRGMQDGLRKTEIEENLFGARGVAAMLPLLRLTKEQREQTYALADSFDSNMLPALQSLQTDLALAGQGIMQNFVYPLARSLLPMVVTVVQFVSKLANAFNWLNEATHGVSTVLLSFAGAVFGIYKVVQAVQMLVSAYKALIASEAIANALSGPVGLATLAAGVAGAGVAMYGINKAIDSASGTTSTEIDSPANKMMRAADKFETNVNKMGDSIKGLGGDALPSDLSGSDIATMARMGKLAAIG